MQCKYYDVCGDLVSCSRCPERQGKPATQKIQRRKQMSFNVGDKVLIDLEESFPKASDVLVITSKADRPYYKVSTLCGAYVCHATEEQLRRLPNQVFRIGDRVQIKVHEANKPAMGAQGKVLAFDVIDNTYALQMDEPFAFGCTLSKTLPDANVPPDTGVWVYSALLEPARKKAFKPFKINIKTKVAAQTILDLLANMQAERGLYEAYSDLYDALADQCLLP